MMDRNREARRAAAMANGLSRRRHRTTTLGGGSLRDSPEDDGPPPEIQDTAVRLRDRAVKKDRENRDRDRDRERMSRSKRRRGDKHSTREEDGSGGVDDSSEESVNDEEDDDVGGPVRYIPSLNPVPITSSSPASSLTSHRKSYPPPTKVFRQSVAPTWKAPDEMIGVSIPRKARSSSTKRGHDWSSGSGGLVSGEPFLRQPSCSPVRSTMTAAAAVIVPSSSPSPSPVPMSPSSSNISIKKKIAKHKPPKSCLKSSSPPNQDDIEIEVAEVLYGLKRQSHAPSLIQETTAVSTLAKFDSRELTMNRSTLDSKSRISSPISVPPHNSTAPLITVAPKRKRPRPYLDENLHPMGFSARTIPNLPNPDQAPKLEAPSPSTEKHLVGSAMENKDLADLHDATPDLALNGMVSDAVKLPLFENGIKSLKPTAVEESGVMRATKVEEASSYSKMESTSTSFKLNPSVAEKENHREKFEIDLMAPPPPTRGSPERAGEVAEYGGGGGGRTTQIMGYEKPMVANGQAEAKPNREEDERRLRLNALSSAEADVVVDAAEPKSKFKSQTVAVPEAQSESECGVLIQKQQVPPPSTSQSDRHFDLQFGFEKAKPKAKAKLELQQQWPQLPPKTAKDEPNADKTGSVPMPMSVAAGWHGGLGPMGYVASPLQGVVPMDGTALASPPVQAAPHFVFTQPKPKRCATHCYIARSVSMHQQAVKMNPYWPTAAAGTAPLFGVAKPYNLNMIPPPLDLHSTGRVAAQDKSLPFSFFPPQPASKDKSPFPSNPTSDPNTAHKKQQQQQQQQQFLLPQSLSPGAPTNMMHAPAFFFPFGQQQAAAAAAAAASGRPSSTKSPSTTGSGASATTTPTSAAMGAAAATSSPAMAAGPAMSFSYPNMAAGNETQFMAILGNSPYPFPVPAHVGGAVPPYRGTHPQAAMSFFNGSFYSSQMLHPSQLQQQQSGAPQPMQIQHLQQQQQQQHQQQSHQNPSISTASSSSQKQQQQQRSQGGGGPSNPSWQNFQPPKGRPSQTHHEMGGGGGGGGEDSPSTADSRTRPSMSVYGQNFTMPFHSANFAMMTPPPPSSSLGGNGSNNPNSNNHGDKKQQQQSQQQAPAFPMSFGPMNGATAVTQGLDISSMTSSHAILQSLPEAARHNYQMMAAAAQAAQAAHYKKKNNYQQDGKSGGGSSNPNASSAEDERKAMGAASRSSAASGGQQQSIAFSKDLVETSISNIPGGGSVVDSSARSLNLIPGSTRHSNRSSGPNNNNNASSNSHQQQQQQQTQMMFAKQQQYVAATVAAARSSKTPTSSNGSVYPDHLNSSTVMAAKFPNALPSFPPLVQGGGGGGSNMMQSSSQWKNSGKPNTTQVSSSPSFQPAATNSSSSGPSNKNHHHHHHQQQGRSQPNHTQISFGSASKPHSSQGQQAPNSNNNNNNSNNNQGPSSPMMGGSPSTSSVSKGAGGSPRTNTSASTGNKAGSTLSNQQGQGRNSPSPSPLSQKPSILGSNKHESQQQPQLSKQSIQQAQAQAQMFFTTAYMQPSSNNSSSPGGIGNNPTYYLQRHRPENQPSGGQKTQAGTPVSSSSTGMLSSGGGPSDPAKAATNSMKGGMPPQGIFHAAAQFGQSAGSTHQLVPAGFPYVHAVPTAVQVKPSEQKQPAGE